MGEWKGWVNFGWYCLKILLKGWGFWKIILERMVNVYFDSIVVLKNEINEIKYICNLIWLFFSFLGGKKDFEDKSVREIVVREMEEEMGLEKSCV